MCRNSCELFEEYRELGKKLVLNKETKNAQIKVTESLEFFSNKFDKLERENKKKNKKMKELEETIDVLTEKKIKV